MYCKTSIARLVLAAALALSAISFCPGEARAQTGMADMPGMAPEAMAAPKKTTPAATPETATGAMSQEEMDAMPGMAPKTAPPPQPAEAAKATAEEAMDAMPGMSPADKSAGAKGVKDDMIGMPGMDAASRSKAKAKSNSKDMDAMPGMAPSEKSSMKGMKGMGAMPEMEAAAGSRVKGQTAGMGAMPGMSPGGASAPPKVSAPGITILRPPQKWVPPRGGNRAPELLSRAELAAFMEPLPAPVMDSMMHGFVLSELLEYRANSAGPNTLDWDFVGWFGGDYHRLWVKTEGSLDLSDGNRGEGDLQLLYGRMIAPSWDFQIGLRGKQNLGSGLEGNGRAYAVVGLQGLSPGNFEIEPSIYISDGGEVSAELTASADYHLTQRLVLQPRFQGEVSFQGDDRFGTGSGVTETDIGLRLRYEIRREFAPYIGVSWLRSYGETARISRREGETSDSFAVVFGLRLWW